MLKFSWCLEIWTAFSLGQFWKVWRAKVSEIWPMVCIALKSRICRSGFRGIWDLGTVFQPTRVLESLEYWWIGQISADFFCVALVDMSSHKNTWLKPAVVFLFYFMKVHVREREDWFSLARLKCESDLTIESACIGGALSPLGSDAIITSSLILFFCGLFYFPIF